MTEKEKRQQRRKDEDAAFNKMLIWIVGAVVAEIFALLARRFYTYARVTDFGIAMMKFCHYFFAIFSIVGLVLTVLGAVWCVSAAKKKKSLYLPGICTALVGILWILSVFAKVLKDTGIQIMVVLPIVAAILILIFFLYQRAFFVNAIVTAAGMALLWILRRYVAAHSAAVIVLFVLAWIVLVVLTVLSFTMKKNEGKLGKLSLVNDAKCYPSFWLSCAVTLVATVLGLALGVTVAYYLMFVLLAWLFCLAVYYTVKMM